MRATLSDIFFMSIRWTLTVFLIFELGILKGLLVSVIILNGFQYILSLALGLQVLNPVDLLFLMDNEKNPSNITCNITLLKNFSCNNM